MWYLARYLSRFYYKQIERIKLVTQNEVEEITVKIKIPKRIPSKERLNWWVKVQYCHPADRTGWKIENVKQ